MDTSELLKKVRKIEIKTKGLSRHLFSGGYHSAFKGRGMSFSEVRDYQYGDDVRNIDWNVTARTGQPYVKVFEEERELTVMMVVDGSGSTYFGTENQTKKDIITELCAVLAFSASNNNDKVGLILFSDQIEVFIPPKKGKKHILRIIRELLDFEPQGKATKISFALEYFNNIIKKRSICFLISDFMDTAYDDALRIASRRHDIIGVHLSDRYERDLPKIGLVRFMDQETNTTRWIDTSDSAVRKKYRARFEDQFKAFQSAFITAGADTIPLDLGDSYINALLKFFKKRAHR